MPPCTGCIVTSWRCAQCLSLNRPRFNPGNIQREGYSHPLLGVRTAGSAARHSGAGIWPHPPLPTGRGNLGFKDRALGCWRQQGGWPWVREGGRPGERDNRENAAKLLFPQPDKMVLKFMEKSQENSKTAESARGPAQAGGGVCGSAGPQGDPLTLSRGQLRREAARSRHMTALLVSVVRADRPPHLSRDSRRCSSAFLGTRATRSLNTAALAGLGLLRPSPVQVHPGPGRRTPHGEDRARRLRTGRCSGTTCRPGPGSCPPAPSRSAGPGPPRPGQRLGGRGRPQALASLTRVKRPPRPRAQPRAWGAAVRSDHRAPEGSRHVPAPSGPVQASAAASPPALRRRPLAPLGPCLSLGSQRK